jgi:hypothetical protein
VYERVLRTYHLTRCVTKSSGTPFNLKGMSKARKPSNPRNDADVPVALRWEAHFRGVPISKLRAADWKEIAWSLAWKLQPRGLINAEMLSPPSKRKGRPSKLSDDEMLAMYRGALSARSKSRATSWPRFFMEWWRGQGDTTNSRTLSKEAHKAAERLRNYKRCLQRKGLI